MGIAKVVPFALLGLGGAVSAQPIDSSLSLARACADPLTDMREVVPLLLENGWSELSPPIGYPTDKSYNKLTPNVLVLAYDLITATQVSVRRQEYALEQAERWINEWNEPRTNAFVPRSYQSLISESYSKLLFKKDVALFSVSRRSGPSETRVACAYSGISHPSDLSLFESFPGYKLNSAVGVAWKILGREDEKGAYAGAFVKIRKDHLEKIFGRGFPELTVFTIKSKK